MPGLSELPCRSWQDIYLQGCGGGAKNKATLFGRTNKNPWLSKMTEEECHAFLFRCFVVSSSKVNPDAS